MVELRDFSMVLGLHSCDTIFVLNHHYLSLFSVLPVDFLNPVGDLDDLILDLLGLLLQLSVLFLNHFHHQIVVRLLLYISHPLPPSLNSCRLPKMD